MSELKPCPFCGAEVQDDERGEKYPRKSPMGGWIIHCECCGASLSQFRKSGKGEISWNTRPIEDALTARIAELESELVTTRQKLTDCEAKIAERDKALNDMVHELSRMEIDKNVLLYETEKVIEKKNDEIANLKLRLALLQDEYRWIPTSERQPKKDWFYFARENVNQVIGYYSWNHKNGWCDGKRKNIKTVTHWMKVPKLTKEESER